MMRIHEEDLPIIDQTLELLLKQYPVEVEVVSISSDEEQAARIKVLLVENGSATMPDSLYIARTKSTDMHLKSKYYYSLYDEQERNVKREELDFEQIKLSINSLQKQEPRNKWAFWMSFAALVLTLVKFLFDMFC